MMRLLLAIALSLAAAVLLGVPLGALAATWPWLAQPVLVLAVHALFELAERGFVERAR